MTATVSDQAFAALRHPGYRAFWLGTAGAMLADNIEHVISYWVVYQKFQSPALGGFAVLAHWVPYLALAISAGALADRFDPRRVIQLGLVLFMAVSLAWGVLFVTDTLQQWHAMVLLVLHGISGVLWMPPSQVLIHDIVEPQDLQSAVRLNATARYLGMLLGPGLGGIMLVVLGAELGILLNALLYLPMILWLWRAPYGPAFRAVPRAPAPAFGGLADIRIAVRGVGHDRTLLSMMLLVGAASFLIGNAYQAQMPGFAQDLGHGDPGLSYSMLLAADAAGALLAGIALESRGLLQARPRTAFTLAVIWCGALAGFALTDVYAFALVLLFVAGFVELAFNAMAQTLVQLRAPAEARGRVIGLFTVASLGFRTFSGITVGLAAHLIGIHQALALSAALLLFVIVALSARDARGRSSG